MHVHFTLLSHPFQSPVGSGACVNPWAGGGAEGTQSRQGSGRHPAPSSQGSKGVRDWAAEGSRGDGLAHPPAPHWGRSSCAQGSGSPCHFIPALVVRTLSPPALETTLAFPGEGQTPVRLPSFPS